MSSIDLTSLTYEPDASSVGVLPNDFTKRWNLNPLTDEGTRGVEVTHSVRWSQPMSQQEAIARFVCHLYIARMPARGLQELYESLQAMFEFYSEPPAKKQALLPEPTTIKAKVSKMIVRPNFTVDYDEE